MVLQSDDHLLAGVTSMAECAAYSSDTALGALDKARVSPSKRPRTAAHFRAVVTVKGWLSSTRREGDDVRRMPVEGLTAPQWGSR